MRKETFLHYRFIRSQAPIALALSFLLAGSESLAYAEQLISFPKPSAPVMVIPQDFGTLEEKFEGTSGKEIIFFQDAHTSLEAQENIAKSIEYLVNQHGIRTVFEEGYEGKVPTDEFFGGIKNAKVKEKVAYFYLDKLRLGAAEYAHIVRKKNFKLIGVDDSELYEENIEIYRAHTMSQEKIAEELEDIHKELHGLASQHFSKELKVWRKDYENYQKGQLGLLQYLERSMKFLGRQPQERDGSHFPSLELLIQAKSSEDENLLGRVRAIKASAIQRDLEALRKEILAQFLSTETQKKIWGYQESLSSFEKLNQLQLTPPEFKKAKEDFKAFDLQALAQFIATSKKEAVYLSRRWENLIKKALEFYEVAEARHSILETRLDSFLKDGREKKAVLVFGGFHAPSIKEILKQKQISYQIISPKITSRSDRHEAYYQQLMQVGHHDYELRSRHSEELRRQKISEEVKQALKTKVLYKLHPESVRSEIRKLATLALNPDLGPRLYDRELTKAIARSEVRTQSGKLRKFEVEYENEFLSAIEAMNPGITQKIERALAVPFSQLVEGLDYDRMQGTRAIIIHLDQPIIYNDENVAAIKIKGNAFDKTEGVLENFDRIAQLRDAGYQEIPKSNDQFATRVVDANGIHHFVKYAHDPHGAMLFDYSTVEFKMGKIFSSQNVLTERPLGLVKYFGVTSEKGESVGAVISTLQHSDPLKIIRMDEYLSRLGAYYFDAIKRHIEAPNEKNSDYDIFTTKAEAMVSEHAFWLQVIHNYRLLHGNFHLGNSSLYREHDEDAGILLLVNDLESAMDGMAMTDEQLFGYIVLNFRHALKAVSRISTLGVYKKLDINWQKAFHHGYFSHKAESRKYANIQVDELDELLVKSLTVPLHLIDHPFLNSLKEYFPRLKFLGNDEQGLAEDFVKSVLGFQWSFEVVSEIVERSQGLSFENDKQAREFIEKVFEEIESRAEVRESLEIEDYMAQDLDVIETKLSEPDTYIGEKLEVQKSIFEFLDQAKALELQSKVPEILIIGPEVFQLRFFSERYPQGQFTLIDNRRDVLEGIQKEFSNDKEIGRRLRLIYADARRLKKAFPEPFFDLIIGQGLEKDTFYEDSQAILVLPEIASEEVRILKPGGVIYHPMDSEELTALSFNPFLKSGHLESQIELPGIGLRRTQKPYPRSEVREEVAVVEETVSEKSEAKPKREVSPKEKRMAIISLIVGFIAGIGGGLLSVANGNDARLTTQFIIFFVSSSIMVMASHYFISVKRNLRRRGLKHSFIFLLSTYLGTIPWFYLKPEIKETFDYLGPVNGALTMIAVDTAIAGPSNTLIFWSQTVLVHKGRIERTLVELRRKYWATYGPLAVIWFVANYAIYSMPLRHSKLIPIVSSVAAFGIGLLFINLFEAAWKGKWAPYYKKLGGLAPIVSMGFLGFVFPHTYLGLSGSQTAILNIILTALVVAPFSHSIFHHKRGLKRSPPGMRSEVRNEEPEAVLYGPDNRPLGKRNRPQQNPVESDSNIIIPETIVIPNAVHIPPGLLNDDVLPPDLTRAEQTIQMLNQPFGFLSLEIAEQEERIHSLLEYERYRILKLMAPVKNKVQPVAYLQVLENSSHKIFNTLWKFLALVIEGEKLSLHSLERIFFIAKKHLKLQDASMFPYLEGYFDRLIEKYNSSEALQKILDIMDSHDLYALPFSDKYIHMAVARVEELDHQAFESLMSILKKKEIEYKGKVPNRLDESLTFGLEFEMSVLKGKRIDFEATMELKKKVDAVFKDAIELGHLEVDVAELFRWNVAIEGNFDHFETKTPVFLNTESGWEQLSEGVRLLRNTVQRWVQQKNLTSPKDLRYGIRTNMHVHTGEEDKKVSFHQSRALAFLGSAMEYWWQRISHTAEISELSRIPKLKLLGGLLGTNHSLKIMSHETELNTVSMNFFPSFLVSEPHEEAMAYLQRRVSIALGIFQVTRDHSDRFEYSSWGESPVFQGSTDIDPYTKTRILQNNVAKLYPNNLGVRRYFLEMIAKSPWKPIEQEPDDILKYNRRETNYFLMDEVDARFNISDLLSGRDEIDINQYTNEKKMMMTMSLQQKVIFEDKSEYLESLRILRRLAYLGDKELENFVKDSFLKIIALSKDEEIQRETEKMMFEYTASALLRQIAAVDRNDVAVFDDYSKIFEEFIESYASLISVLKPAQAKKHYIRFEKFIQHAEGARYQEALDAMFPKKHTKLAAYGLQEVFDRSFYVFKDRLWGAYYVMSQSFYASTSKRAFQKIKQTVLNSKKEKGLDRQLALETLVRVALKSASANQVDEALDILFNYLINPERDKNLQDHIVHKLIQEGDSVNFRRTQKIAQFSRRVLFHQGDESSENDDKSLDNLKLWILQSVIILNQEFGWATYVYVWFELFHEIALSEDLPIAVRKEAIAGLSKAAKDIKGHRKNKGMMMGDQQLALHAVKRLEKIILNDVEGSEIPFELRKKAVIELGARVVDDKGTSEPIRLRALGFFDDILWERLDRKKISLELRILSALYVSYSSAAFPRKQVRARAKSSIQRAYEAIENLKAAVWLWMNLGMLDTQGLLDTDWYSPDGKHWWKYDPMPALGGLFGIPVNWVTRTSSERGNQLRLIARTLENISPEKLGGQDESIVSLVQGVLEVAQKAKVPSSKYNFQQRSEVRGETGIGEQLFHEATFVASGYERVALWPNKVIDVSRYPQSDRHRKFEIERDQELAHKIKSLIRTYKYKAENPSKLQQALLTSSPLAERYQMIQDREIQFFMTETPFHYFDRSKKRYPLPFQISFQDGSITYTRPYLEAIDLNREEDMTRFLRDLNVALALFEEYYRQVDRMRDHETPLGIDSKYTTAIFRYLIETLEDPETWSYGEFHRDDSKILKELEMFYSPELYLEKMQNKITQKNRKVEGQIWWLLWKDRWALFRAHRESKHLQEKLNRRVHFLQEQTGYWNNKVGFGSIEREKETWKSIVKGLESFDQSDGYDKTDYGDIVTNSPQEHAREKVERMIKDSYAQVALNAQLGQISQETIDEAHQNVVRLHRISQKIDNRGYHPEKVQRSLLFFLMRIGDIEGFYKVYRQMLNFQHIAKSHREEGNTQKISLILWERYAIPYLRYIYRALAANKKVPATDETLLEKDRWKKVVLPQEAGETSKFLRNLTTAESYMPNNPILLPVLNTDDVFGFNWESEKIDESQIVVDVYLYSYDAGNIHDAKKSGHLRFELLKENGRWRAVAKPFYSEEKGAYVHAISVDEDIINKYHKPATVLLQMGLKIARGTIVLNNLNPLEAEGKKLHSKFILYAPREEYLEDQLDIIGATSKSERLGDLEEVQGWLTFYLDDDRPDVFKYKNISKRTKALEKQEGYLRFPYRDRGLVSRAGRYTEERVNYPISTDPHSIIRQLQDVVDDGLAEKAPILILTMDEPGASSDWKKYVERSGLGKIFTVHPTDGKGGVWGFRERTGELTNPRASRIGDSPRNFATHELAEYPLVIKGKRFTMANYPGNVWLKIDVDFFPDLEEFELQMDFLQRYIRETGLRIDEVTFNYSASEIDFESLYDFEQYIFSFRVAVLGLNRRSEVRAAENAFKITDRQRADYEKRFRRLKAHKNWPEKLAEIQRKIKLDTESMLKLFESNPVMVEYMVETFLKKWQILDRLAIPRRLRDSPLKTILRFNVDTLELILDVMRESEIKTVTHQDLRKIYEALDARIKREQKVPKRGITWLVKQARKELIEDNAHEREEKSLQETESFQVLKTYAEETVSNYFGNSKNHRSEVRLAEKSLQAEAPVFISYKDLVGFGKQGILEVLTRSEMRGARVVIYGFDSTLAGGEDLAKLLNRSEVRKNKNLRIETLSLVELFRKYPKLAKKKIIHFASEGFKVPLMGPQFYRLIKRGPGSLFLGAQEISATGPKTRADLIKELPDYMFLDAQGRIDFAASAADNLSHWARRFERVAVFARAA